MKTKNLFWGVFFIVSAALIVANQMGYFSQLGLPFLILLIFMVPIVIKSVAYLNFFGIVLPIALLFSVYNRNAEVVDLSIWAILLAALFLSIGLTILFGRYTYHNRFFFHSRSKDWKDHWHDPKHGTDFENHRHMDSEETSENMNGEMISIYESFGASSKYVNSEGLERMDIKVSFGAVKVYFSDTELKSNMAEVFLNLTFSGVELYVPKHWRVQNNVNGTFGGLDEKNRNYAAPDAPVLNLTGGVTFSGVEVIYV